MSRHCELLYIFFLETFLITQLRTLDVVVFVSILGKTYISKNIAHIQLL